MPRVPFTSPQTDAVLRSLAADPSKWRYGLSLSTELDIASGTLYPLLIRLAEAGFLESRWMDPEKAGRPARHGYRLSPAGRDLARQRMLNGKSQRVRTVS